MGKEDYSGAIGGGLKFKGDGVKKKKKKHPSKIKEGDKAEDMGKALEKTKSPAREDADAGAGREQGESFDEPTNEQLKDLSKSRMTESERAFAAKRRERMLKDERASLKSYEERKQQFAKALATAPEHNDMPKVGPG